MFQTAVTGERPVLPAGFLDHATRIWMNRWHVKLVKEGYGGFIRKRPAGRKTERVFVVNQRFRLNQMLLGIEKMYELSEGATRNDIFEATRQLFDRGFALRYKTVKN